MIRLINHIAKYITLTSEEYMDIVSYFEVLRLDKKVKFIEYGASVNSIYFILDGLAYASISGHKEQEHVIKFYQEDCWINIDSIINNEPSSLYDFHTVEDTFIGKISIYHMKFLIAKYPVLKDYIMSVLVTQNKKKDLRIINLNINNAENKYNIFINTFPDLSNRVNLYYIASYLAIQPETLSRIRNMYKNRKEKYYQ